MVNKGRKMIRVVICDDNRVDIDIVKKLLVEYSFRQNIDIECTDCLTGTELLKVLETGEKYDVYILDVEIDAEDGISVASAIRRNYDKHAIIIFVSNYPRHMGRSFSVHAYNYLQKPLEYVDLEQVFSQIMREIKDIEFNKLIVPVADGQRVVNISDILYIETSREFQKSVDIHLVDQIIQTTGNLKRWYKVLKDKRFTYSYRGYVVNMDHIIALRNSKVVLDNREQIPLSRRYEENLKKEFISAAISDINK